MKRTIGVTTHFYGDSNTDGYLLTDKTKRFSNLVNAEIHKICRAFQLNDGYNGYSTDQLIPIVRSTARGADADIIVIHLGTNDVTAARTQQSVNDNLTTIIKTIRDQKSSGVCDIYLCTLIPRFDAVSNTPYNATITAVAAAQGVTLIDLSTSIPNSTYMNPDNIHPLDTGHQLVANTIAPVITARSSIWKRS